MKTSLRIHFRNHFALVETGYFDLVEGRLVLKEEGLGPIVDVHTHLALAYGLPLKVYLWAKSERTEHYLPLGGPLDMGVYMNSNFTDEDLTRMRRDLTVRSLTSRGMRSTHTASNLLAEMKELGITKSALLPIDYPWLSKNADTYLALARDCDDLISLGSVHPHAKKRAEKLDRQVAAGARGIKVHPAVQMVAPDHPKAMELYEMCAARGLPVLWHCGPVGIEPRLGRYLSQLKHYWRAVADHPDTVFILGHSGARQFEAGLDLARTYDNVYLETSSQGIENVRRIVKEAPSDRIMFGSDWPFYHQAAPLAKALMVTEDCKPIRKKLLWENAVRLFRIPC